MLIKEEEVYKVLTNKEFTKQNSTNDLILSEDNIQQRLGRILEGVDNINVSKRCGRRYVQER